MTPEKSVESVKYSDEWFLRLYLASGSVEEAIASYPENLPISAANFHRLVVRNGLVTSAGRHVSLPETLHFFRLKAMEQDTPLERLYREFPPSFKTSLSTLHRVYQRIEKGLVNRKAAALLISAESDRTQILIGRELTGNSRYGKHAGDFSIPMGFSRQEESSVESVARVLQQEVFAGEAAKGNLHTGSELFKKIVPENIEPIAYFDIVDVEVSVYCLSIPIIHPAFESYKLAEHQFLNFGDMEALSLRTGVGEIVNIYQSYLDNPYTVEFPVRYRSEVNLALSQVFEL